MPDMNNSPDLPSSRALVRSTVIAAVVAAGLLVTVILPAEYGVDPTGIGRVLGLTQMGKIKAELAKEAAAIASFQAPRVVVAFDSSSPTRASAEATTTHVSEVVLKPNEGKEIKLVMRKGGRVTYSWETDRGVVNFDTHADAPGIKYHGYAKGSARKSDEGVLVAAFDGAHGWFWRNRGREPVTVTLRTSGEYQELKRM